MAILVLFTYIYIINIEDIQRVKFLFLNLKVNKFKILVECLLPL